MRARAVAATVCASVVLSACGAVQGDWKDSYVEGTWESSSSGAVIVFGADGTYAADGFLMPGPDSTCSNPGSEVAVDRLGTWEPAKAFVILDGTEILLFRDRTWKGTPTLTFQPCVDGGPVVDRFTKVDDGP